MKAYVVRKTYKHAVEGMNSCSYFYKDYAWESWLFDPAFDEKNFMIYTDKKYAEYVLDCCLEYYSKQEFYGKLELVEVDLNF